MTDMAYHLPVGQSGRGTSSYAGNLSGLTTLTLLVALSQAPAHADEKSVYRCPGNLYTDALSAKEARDKGCKTLDGAPITVIQSVAPKGASASKSSDGGAPGEKVSPDDQKARDADRRKILDAELRKEEEALAGLQKEFNNGQPERKGDERNFQKYQDRINEMRSAITRKESDVSSVKRELGKLGMPNAGASK
jgi:hypothetical protein